MAPCEFSTSPKPSAGIVRVGALSLWRRANFLRGRRTLCMRGWPRTRPSAEHGRRAFFCALLAGYERESPDLTEQACAADDAWNQARLVALLLRLVKRVWTLAARSCRRPRAAWMTSAQSCFFQLATHFFCFQLLPSFSTIFAFQRTSLTMLKRRSEQSAQASW